MGMCITINEAMQFNPLRLNDRSSVAPQLFYFKSNGMSGTSAVTTEVKDTDKVNRPRELRSLSYFVLDCSSLSIVLVILV